METLEQIDPTQDSSENINKKIVSGAAILTLRTFLMQAISFFATALLTIFLQPFEYGVFFLISAFINFLAYFGDIGFAAALIQKKEQLSKTDLKTIFTIQQTLVLIILLVTFLITPIIKSFYNLSEIAIYLLWALAFSLFLSSLKTIPTVLMERKLEFNKWVIPQIVETIIFNISAVYLAWMGFGITSFTIAVLLRGIFGLFTTYLVQPWMPSFGISRDSLKSLLKFGIPYQLNIFLAMIKDDGMTIFLGYLLGPSGIGLLGWAQKWAYAPLRFFMDQVIKVTFPAFSKLQDKKDQLSKAVSKSIFFVCLLVFPSLVMLVLTAPTLLEIIPKYNKWNPALFALSILSITSALAAVTTPITNTLNAIGKISITFKLMVMWTALTWILVPIFVLKFGLNGAALGFTLVGLSSFVALYIASKYIDINYFQSVGKPFIASTIMALLVLLTRNILPASFIQIVSMVFIGFVSYLVSVLFLDPKIFSLIKGIIQKND